MKTKCDLCKKQLNVLVKVQVADGNFAPDTVDKAVMYCRTCLAKVAGA